MSRRSLALGFCCAVVFCAATAVAQLLATLQGYVSDETGGRLPGVTVEIRNIETGLTRVLVTDESGFYTAPKLPSGKYTMTASLPGFQTIVRENIILLVGQVIDIDLRLGVASVEETVTVTAESPVVETSRSSTARYVTEEEITNLPISGRDYVQFALLSPTVKSEPNRGGISLAGQRGVNSGLAIDGTEAKSAFFGYGRGGEATENDGLVVAQESVQEFQVIINGFAPEYSRNGGGYVNVVTKSGTNEVSGSGFLFFTNDGLSSRLQRSPLDEARGIPVDDPRFDNEDFRRYSWGASIGGPVVRDKTHFFFSYDQLDRTVNFIDRLNGRGQYDALLARFPSLVDGYTPSNDGIAAPDPVNGRTALGNFVRGVDNLILFGKVNHQINADHSLSVRYNFTDYDRASELKSEESLKKENTHSFVGSLVSIFGTNMVNELRFQYAKDALDRLSNLDPSDIVAEVVIENPTFDTFGKADFLPIFVREKKFQIQDNVSYHFADHDVKFGFDLNVDDLSEFFAGAADGEYTYRTIDDFLTDNARRGRIYFGNVQNPNFEVTQQTVGIFAQDSWKVNERLTLNYGLRWDGTFNPSDIPHVLEEGRQIPDDLNNFAPRIGFAYSPDESQRSVIRGGVGLFHARTPTLIFFNVYQDNGIFPNFGRVTVVPGQTGYVPIGDPIDNENPPAGLTPALAFVADGFEDPETWRVNLGYERELEADFAANVDFTYARGRKLQGSYDLNAFAPSPDAFGRPIYPRGRPQSDVSDVRIRDDFGRSEYYAFTVGANKRFSRGFQFQTHYTWSRDRDNDSNERSATSVTVTDFTNFDYDWGFSERDVTHRFVFSGVFQLPGEFLLSGIFNANSGLRFTSVDPNDRLTNHPSATIQARAVVDGQRAERNTFRAKSFYNLDVRINKFFTISGARFEIIAEIFNLFNNRNFALTDGAPGATLPSQAEPFLDDGITPNPEFGLESVGLSGQRQAQLGVRFMF